MTDINDVISKINHYQYDIKKGVINKFAKLNTTEFIKKEYEIFKSLLKEKETEVAKEIRKAAFGDGEVSTWEVDTDRFLERIIRLNKASMAYDRYLVNLNCKYHVLYLENYIEAYKYKTVFIDERSNHVILDRHNTHARIINYDNNEVNYIDIPRRNLALSPDKLTRGSEYTTFNDEVNEDVHEMKCDNDPNISWLCNGLYHSIKNVKGSDNLNIVVPIINIDYDECQSIIDKMINITKELVNFDYFELTRDGKKTTNESDSNDCAVYIMTRGNKRTTIIGLVLFDRIDNIHRIFKEDISDDYNVIDKFTNDDIFNKIKGNYTKFPTFVYKMCCLNYAIKYYSNYNTTIIDLYYAAKLVFFSHFNFDFEGGIDKKNVDKLNNKQKNAAKAILNYIIDAKDFFRVNDNINKHWLNLNDLNNLGFIPKFKTGGIKIPKFGDSPKDKLKDVIPRYLEEIRDEIIHLYATHNNFKNMMINDIIKNESVPKTDSISDTIDTIKQVIGENTEKLVCIPVFCMDRHTSSFNYDLMESIINSINKKIKEKADVKEDLLQLNFT